MPSCSANLSPVPGPSNGNLGFPPTREEAWIAIEPPGSSSGKRADPSPSPPSFESAQFDTVLRRHHQRQKQSSGTKTTTVPSRYLNLSHTFEFAGWGTLIRTDIAASEVSKGEADVMVSQTQKTLGQYTASSVAGAAVLGSIFYTLPVVFVVSSVYAPISLFIATLTLFLWRPIMEELTSALPLGGAPYSYLLNVSSKSLALVGAAALLLDYAATAVVSAATAVAYLDGEVVIPFPFYVGTLLILFLFAIISLSGIRESARIAFAVLTLHAVSMLALFIASIVEWAKVGNDRLRDTWHHGTMNSNRAHIPRQIFDGVCIGMLGLTGFECVPSYASSIKPGRFPRVLRNIHLPAIVLNTVSMLLVMALVPYKDIINGQNILSMLAQNAAGRWLRVWVVVDAIIVLCAGVFAGVLSTCELVERLTCDRLLPQIFMRKLPVTQTQYVSVFVYTLFCCAVYATTGASLDVVSKMFTLVWLFVMTLFPLSSLLLKFNRGRLAREPRVSILVVFLTFGVAFTVIGGNIAIDPTIVGYSAAYFAVIASFFYATMKKGKIVRWFFWLHDQFPGLHRNKWEDGIGGLMRKLRKQPVCILAKTDEINRLFHKLQYVSQNEETSCLKLVHFYNEEEGIPSEMEANWKILDEAFPEITIDLVLVRGNFNPPNVAALSHHLSIPTTLMFMSCPGPDFPYSAAELNTRIITL